MKKLEKFDGQKTYMFPNGAIATPEEIKRQFPAVGIFTHVIETDEAGQVCFAVENLAAVRSFYGIDSTLSEEDALEALEEIINAEPETEVSAEERIAAALEYQNMASMEDVEVVE
ncbi:MAG: hypothetical protein J6B87_06235 [Clostridia bacterium]|nr:hypothetical protein [Clostridia bacterium]